jgi:dihydrofolate reductase
MATEPEIALIAALDRNHAIGQRGALPWHIPEDLQHFKRMTLNQTVLMGRKTYDSIGRALPKRRNLVLTRNTHFAAPGIDVVHSIDAAAKLVAPGDTLWVIGGGELYLLAMPRATRLELTHVELAVTDADAWFPQIPASFLVLAERASAQQRLSFRFVSYTRRAKD